MIGMNFISFLILLIISVVVSGSCTTASSTMRLPGSSRFASRSLRGGWRVARIACLWLLASSVPFSQLREHLVYPRDSGGARGSGVGG